MALYPQGHSPWYTAEREVSMLNLAVKRKSLPLPGNKPQLSSPQTSYYTYSATMSPKNTVSRNALFKEHCFK
jgi:hypothetical protein